MKPKDTDTQLPEEGIFNFEDLIGEENNKLHTDVNGKSPEELETERLAAEQIETDRIAAEALEEEKEEKTPEEIEAERIEAEALEKEKSTTKKENLTGFSLRVNTYLESNRWEDALVEVDGEQVAISALEEIDEELFFQLDEAQEQLRADKLKEKYINVDDLDPTTQKLNEISLAGGDITELIKVYDDYVNPLTGLDLEDQAVQEAIVRNDLKRLNLEEAIIDITIEKYKKDLTLDTKANTIVDNINTAFQGLLDKKENEAKEKEKVQLQTTKTFKEGLKNVFTESKLEEKEIKKLVSFATAQGKDGTKEIQKEFDKVLKDPETAADLIFFLHNPSAFLEMKGAKQDRAKKIKDLKLINIIPKKDGKSKTSASRKKDESQFTFEEIKK